MTDQQFNSKLTIIAYLDPLFQKRIEGDNEIELQVNPQEISLSFGIEDGEGEIDNSSGLGKGVVSQESATGESFKPKVFKGYSSPDLSIETTIDASGLLKPPKGINYMTENGEANGLPSIQPYLAKLKNVCYNFQSKTHGPPYLALVWGSVFSSASNDPQLKNQKIFKCILSSLDIKYCLFGKKGNPVRADIVLKFRGFQDPETRATGNSPDLSHFVEVKYGDNLPALCKDIYGSTEFFMQVAKINKLSSIYAIKPGMTLLFPPLDKASR